MSWNDLRERAGGDMVRTFAHASPVTHIPAAGSQTVFNPAGGNPPFATFDAAFRLVELGDGEVPIDSTAPVLHARLSDFAVQPAQDDTLTIDGVTWRVASVQPDGQGLAALILRKSP